MPADGRDTHAYDRPMLAATDENIPVQVAARLAARGHDVLTTRDLNLLGASDVDLLASAREERRVLVTNDVTDFIAIARRWMARGDSHAGLILVPTAALPGQGAALKACVDRLSALLDEHPHQDDWVDQVRWLPTARQAR